MFYSEKVLNHFENPRNVGKIENADGIGEIGDVECGDKVVCYIKIKDDIIEDIKFKTFGCCAAIAVSSMVSVMAKGVFINEALLITDEKVIKELDGLPENKEHCSNLGAGALHNAIKDYINKVKVK